jgi:hypothetical protein
MSFWMLFGGDQDFGGVVQLGSVQLSEASLLGKSRGLHELHLKTAGQQLPMGNLQLTNSPAVVATGCCRALYQQYTSCLGPAWPARLWLRHHPPRSPCTLGGV